jgi:exodeoxyribonuclease VII small subunit
MADMTQDVPGTVTFEEALSRLEEVVRTLEERELPLEESLAYFEEGVRLTRFCRSKLKEIESRVELLVKGAQGEDLTVPFEVEED